MMPTVLEGGAAKPATIYDVARAAGVSHQTVSRVLRGLPGMSEATRLLVQQALDDLGYRPSRAARALNSPGTRKIAVVGYEVFESSTARVLRGADEAARAAGYELDIVPLDPHGDVGEIAARLEAIGTSDVVGVLATAPTVQTRRALDQVRLRVPVLQDSHADVDERPGPLHGTSRPAQQAMEHLLDLGHRRVVHVAGPEAWEASTSRARVYAALMEAAGAEPLPLLRGTWSAASGHAAVAAGAWDPTVTAVFVANDRMALGVMLALHQRGLRVPEDVSVIGIDDIPEAAYFTPPLTTVRIAFEEVGRAAVRGLVALMGSGGSPVVVEHPASELVVRSTTAPVRPARGAG